MRRLVARLSLAVLLAGPISAQAQVTSQDTVAYTTASVRLREKPFANARALAALPQGTAVRLYTCSQGWCSVAVSQLAGYLRARNARRTAEGLNSLTSFEMHTPWLLAIARRMTSSGGPPTEHIGT